MITFHSLGLNSFDGLETRPQATATLAHAQTFDPCVVDNSGRVAQLAVNDQESGPHSSPE